MNNHYVVTGITGQVGGEVARNLLEAGLPVRGVVRTAAKGTPWAEQGCEIAVAQMENAAAWASAWEGAEGVFILAPSSFDPSLDFREARSLAETLKTALTKGQPRRVVYLSTIGAQSERTNLLSQHSIIEAVLRTVDLPITFLRPGWFMENCAWDVKPAQQTGVIPSFLQPLEHVFPLVATQDIGRVAAELMQESWTGLRTVELEGPTRVSPLEIADAFASALGRPVRMEAVPRATWSALFLAQGMKKPRAADRDAGWFQRGMDRIRSWAGEQP